MPTAPQSSPFRFTVETDNRNTEVAVFSIGEVKICPRIIGNTKRHGSNNRRKLDGRAERITRAHTFHIVCNGELVQAVISRRINAELVIRPESRFVMTGRHREFAPRVPDTAEIREIREERSSSFFVNHAFELQRAVYIRCQSFTPQVSAGTKFHLTERYCFELGGGSASCRRPSRRLKPKPQRLKGEVFSSFVCFMCIK